MRPGAPAYRDRALEPHDARFVVSLHRLKHAARFMHCPTEARIAELAVSSSVRARIVLDGTSAPVGFMAMSNHDGWLVEIHGIVVQRPGEGIDLWALGEAMRWSFVDVGAHRVWLEVTAANATARHLYERAGFRHEGTYRDGYRAAEGRYEGLAHYGILRPEWCAGRNTE